MKRSSLLRPALLVPVLVWGLGCARGHDLVRPLDLDASATAAVGLAPWQIAPSELGTQRLYRVRLESRDPQAPGDKDNRGRFRLTLRLATPDLYQLNAVDPLGRGLWTLHVEGDRGVLVDYRDKRVCTYGGDVDLANLQLGPFPIRRLPAAILGRLPTEPRPGFPVIERPGEVEILDAAARRWIATLDPADPADPPGSGRLTAWRLVRPGGGPEVHFYLDEQGQRHLEDPAEGLTLHWREIVAEPSPQPPTLPAVPEKFTHGGCPSSDVGTGSGS